MSEVSLHLLYKNIFPYFKESLFDHIVTEKVEIQAPIKTNVYTVLYHTLGDELARIIL